MAKLPAGNSPLWDKMEDDVAEERWRLAMFPWTLGWYRGSARSRRRRWLFRRIVDARMNPVYAALRWIFIGFFIADVLWSYSRLSEAGRTAQQPVLCVVALMLLVAVILRWMQARVFDRGVRAYIAAQTEAELTRLHLQPWRR